MWSVIWHVLSDEGFLNKIFTLFCLKNNLTTLVSEQKIQTQHLIILEIKNPAALEIVFLNKSKVKITWPRRKFQPTTKSNGWCSEMGFTWCVFLFDVFVRFSFNLKHTVWKQMSKVDSNSNDDLFSFNSPNRIRLQRLSIR